jgi:hypothetical protein
MVNGRGRGKETVKGQVLFNKPQRKMISHMLLICSCRRKCIRQIWTPRANQSGFIYCWKHYPCCQLPKMMVPTLPRSQMANMMQHITLICICAWRMRCMHWTELV